MEHPDRQTDRRSVILYRRRRKIEEEDYEGDLIGPCPTSVGGPKYLSTERCIRLITMVASGWGESFTKLLVKWKHTDVWTDV